ncbi:hypothetical protein OAA39_00040 [bacterium]|nr:hypothetical protein [bacterium]
MAITLRGLLRGADEEGQFTLNHPDGTTSTLPFEQRNFGYGEGAGKLNFNTQPPFIINDFDGRPLPGVEQSTNSNLGNLIDDVTNNFVRGGAVTLVKRAATDFERLGKVLLSANGISFIAAQFALARTNPQNIISPTNRLFNSLPVPGTSLLATAATGAAGIRFRRDGLADINFESGFNYDPSKGGVKYESSILELSKLDIDDTSDHTIRGAYFNIHEGGFGGREDLIKEYGGGAHSTFGIGNTEIKRYKADPYNGYLPLFNQDLFQLRKGPNPSKANAGESGDIYTDYRTQTGKKTDVKKTRINLYGLGEPDKKVELDENGSYNVYIPETIDKISAANIFKRVDQTPFDNEFEDYIKFRIAVVNTENPREDNVILFRAFLDNLSDNYSGDWNSFKYNGRAENFYVYSGFDRKISLGFKIHAQTRHEQRPLWRKLNYLVAQTAPEYKNRRMRGVFSRLTVGDWMDEIPGFFTSVNLSWNSAYPWEIKYDKNGNDRDVNQYPHILDVSCEFQPVHNFAPSNSVTTPFILPEISENIVKYADVIEPFDEFNEVDSTFLSPDVASANQLT